MDVFVARQPIFDRAHQVVAYELLFRSGLTNCFDRTMGPNPEQATSHVIAQALSALRLEELTGGKRAFINFTRDLLLSDLPFMLPADWVVVEVLENVPPDRETMQALRHLRGKGYTLALDDFQMVGGRQVLIEPAHIIKVDFLVSGPDQRRELMAAGRERGCKMLAEKVETPQQYEQALSEGFDLFQGYFFSKPTVKVGRQVSAARSHSLGLLQALQRPGLEIGDLENAVRSEVSLCYKLLRYINSPFFGIRREVQSVGHGLAMLGLEESRKWLTLAVLSEAAENSEREVAAGSLIRGLVCQSLAQGGDRRRRADEFFLTGLLSRLDVLLGMPMADILAQLPLPDSVNQALLGAPGELRDMLELAGAMETGAWHAMAAKAAELGIAEETVAGHYLEAIKLSDRMLS